MDRIPVFDYLEQHRRLGDEILEAVRRVFGSGRLVLGEQVRAFEEAFVGYLGAGGEGIGVGNGTDALALALRAVGVGPDDEVVTVANTAVPTVAAIRMVGARPVFCDVDAHTCLMDSGSLESAITPRTKAVIPVHLFGNVADMDAILAVAARHGIRVVEDCAQAHGAVRDGRMAGTFGDVACFSFYPTKNLGAYGDGGLCYTRDPALGRAIREMRMYGFREGYYSHREGVNSRLDEVQAAILGVKLRHLPALLDARRDRAARYDRGLGAALERTPAERGVIHAYHLYVVKVDAREEVVRRLDAARIGWGIHYPAPIHLMSGYAFLGYRPGDLPVTEALAGRILSLPMYPELPEEAVDRVCAVLNGER